MEKARTGKLVQRILNSRAQISIIAEPRLRGIDGQIGHGDTFHIDCQPDLKADYILANPPFNISD